MLTIIKKGLARKLTMTKKVELPVLLIEFNRLKLGPRRNRHKLHTPTTCPLCYTKLKWQHMLKRHQKSEKCQMIQITLASVELKKSQLPHTSQMLTLPKPSVSTLVPSK